MRGGIDRRIALCALPSLPDATRPADLGTARGGDGAAEVGPTQARGRSDAPGIEDLAHHFPQLEILEILGRGGMGAVYKARQKSLDRIVALKVIRPTEADDRSFAERFVREARALAQLSHPNIVTVHDFGQTGGLYYFIMEFVDGLNLRQMLQSGKLDPGEALEIVPHVCDALQYAHDEGVVHRDIKPENILIDKKGRVKIADFGLAKLLKGDPSRHALTKTNHVMGTPHYMAPEQIERPLSVDHRADIYSLGVVIYEMLTGELPIGRFAPPSQRVCIDVRLDKVVLRTLEKQPERRYQTISEVKTDMESVGGHAADAWDARLAPEPVMERAPIEKPPRVVPKPVYREDPRISNINTYFAGGFLGAILDRQTYINLAYLLLAFPLGIFYFVFLVTGLSLGLGLLIVWIGAIILPAVLIFSRWFGMFERWLSAKMLNLEIPEPMRRATAPNLKTRLKTLMTDSTTWTGIVYLLLKFPLGIVSFVVPVVLLIVSLSLVAEVLLYKMSWIRPPMIGGWKFDSLPEAAMLGLLGLVLFPISLHVINGLAWFSGRLARLCLGRRSR